MDVVRVRFLEMGIFLLLFAAWVFSLVFIWLILSAPMHFLLALLTSHPLS